MEENKNEQQILEDAVKELKEPDEEKLKEIIEKWFESTRTQGMKIGATYISMGVYSAIRKNIEKASKPSLRDYKRAISDIMRILEVQLKTEQNDSEELADDTAKNI